MPRFITPKLTAAILFSLLPVSIYGQQIELPQQYWSAELIRPHGQPVIPLFDGWFQNDDGSNTMCFGYFNLNSKQAVDIPIGEANYLSDTRFPTLLPTHFDPLPPRYRHIFCAFSITVPEDFGRDEKIVWHLSSAGEKLSVPGHLKPAYVLDEPSSKGRGNLAPLIRLDAKGAGIRGRKGIHNRNTLSATVGQPLTVEAWIEHPDPEVWTGWSHHAGAGKVDFDIQETMITTASGHASVNATFSEPGEYTIRLQTIDSVAAFEFYCCHSNAYYNISVSN